MPAYTGRKECRGTLFLVSICWHLMWGYTVSFLLIAGEIIESVDSTSRDGPDIIHVIHYIKVNISTLSRLLTFTPVVDE